VLGKILIIIVLNLARFKVRISGFEMLIIIVLNPVRSKVWVPGFDRITGSPGSIFLKSKRHLLVKTKVNRLQPSFLSGHTGFFLTLFFLKLCPVPAPGRPGPGSTCQASPGFKTVLIITINISFSFLSKVIKP
jgi:hypothetical protein